MYDANSLVHSLVVAGFLRNRADLQLQLHHSIPLIVSDKGMAEFYQQSLAIGG